MEAINDILESITVRIENLIHQRDKYRELVEVKEKEIISLQNKLKIAEQEIFNLKEEKQLDKLTYIISNSSEISEAKETINVLLKKINRSIAVISSLQEDGISKETDL